MKSERFPPGGAALAVLATLVAGLLAGVAGARPAARDDAGARAAFAAAAPVFFHPRCMNCHPAGDRPLQGDDSHAHTQNVRRGNLGNGVYGMKC
ncbi:MAG TPA: hypothetical protein VMV61_13340, partial [Patescibacteria group bacterium]|nr:hypothetical protein [Patescibacteria group bacterium]